MAALVVNMPRPTTTLRLNNMLTAGDLEDESSFGDIEEETKVSSWLVWFYHDFFINLTRPQHFGCVVLLYLQSVVARKG